MNSHYQALMEQMGGDKDAIFEPCVVKNYDPSTMLAKVYTLHSKQYRDFVPVLFPSLYLNSGVITPPAKDSTGILFWGAENLPFLFPANYLPPAPNLENGEIKQTSSPSQIDSSLGFDHVEGGEFFARSLGGAFVHVRNLDEVEIGTSHMHRFALSGVDGSAELAAERLRTAVGGAKVYSGPAMDGSGDFQWKLEIDDTIPEQLSDLDDDTLVSQVLSDTFDTSIVTDSPALFEHQMGNVYDGSAKIQSGVDGADLFSRGILYTKDVSQVRTERLRWELSKEGSLQLKIENDQYASVFTFHASGLSVVSQDKLDSNPDTNTRTNTLGFG